MSFKQLQSVVLALFLGFAFSTSQSNAQLESLKWESSLEAASKKAAQTGKPILLHFWRPDCAPCLQLESYVFSDPEMIDRIEQSVIPVKINTYLHQDLVKKYEVKSVPYDIVLDSQGGLVFRRSSPTRKKNYKSFLKTTEQLLQKLNPQLRKVAGTLHSQQKARSYENQKSPFIGKEAAKFGRYDSRVANRLDGQRDQMALPEANTRYSGLAPSTDFVLPTRSSLRHTASTETGFPIGGTTLPAAKSNSSRIQNPHFPEPNQKQSSSASEFSASISPVIDGSPFRFPVEFLEPEEFYSSCFRVFGNQKQDHCTGWLLPGRPVER